MLTPRPVAGSVEELLADATVREPFGTTDSKSGSEFERVLIDGEWHVVKYIHVDGDFTMRVLGDIAPLPVAVWQSGLMDCAPDLISHGVVGAARGWGRNGWGGAVLMHDMSDEMIPPGDDAVSLDDHFTMLDHLAGMSARTWNWRDDVGLVPYENRWQFFGLGSDQCEQELGFPVEVNRIAAGGWVQFDQRAPADVRETIEQLRTDGGPLISGLRSTPSSFLHGDWKLGNVGRARDGRTILIDWSYPGEGPVCHELGWYLALNAARIPCSKEESIAAFRKSLEQHGVATADWFDRQLDLALLGTLVQFGWEKALGSGDELGWWCERARMGAARL